MSDPATDGTGGMHILIVEDSPTQAAGLKAILTEKWDDVRWATDGAKALNLMRQRQPVLVVSDIEMPVLTGYEMTRVMKGDTALRSIPVILLTELASPSAITQAIDSNADCLLMKPYDPERLFAVIDRVLSAAGSADGNGHAGKAENGAACDVASERDRLRRLLTFALDELADQHRRLVAAEEQLEIL